MVVAIMKGYIIFVIIIHSHIGKSKDILPVFLYS